MKDVRAAYRPQGTCPKPWIVLVDGEPLRDRRGGVKRFKDSVRAKAAGEAAACETA